MEEIQIMTPSPAATPYTTAPSSPHRFPSFFYSAPTSPIHALVGFQQHDDTDFAFNFTGNPQPPSISAADELFHAGIIKPLKPVPDDPSRCNNKNINSFTETFSQTPGDQDYFSQAFTQTLGDQTQNPPKRGRKTTTSARTTRDKLSRSSSPFRISDILSDDENNNNNNNNNKNSPNWYSKWNLKNLILFRSVSEGSARRSKDPVNKYSRITTKFDEDVKNSSFRSAESCRSVAGASRKVSAHEMHYTANRAVAEEMRRKTYLPYKSGLFGCLGFHNNGAAGSVHQISKGITTVVMKQR
ncbi:hypothetical protein HanRHA438_Chr04g0201561 [Helianthus annuus]|nr:hypothetical protein HanOQP8_Chr04g0169141 [Helianthus annuus]KAJ0929128.1 hypothetical protein HanRHA438_Chr04g0201561 [Helianthus annuus]